MLETILSERRRLLQMQLLNHIYQPRKQPKQTKSSSRKKNFFGMEAMPFLCTGVWFSSIIKPYNYKIGFIFAIINFFIFLKTNLQKQEMK